MFLGVVALGFGFAYISRMGEVSTLFDQGYTDAMDYIQGGSGGSEKYLTIPEPILNQSEETIEEEESEDVAEETIEEEDVLDDDEIDSVLDEVAEEISQPDVTPSQMETKSQYNYDLQLDNSVLSAIQNSLATTPHDGFKPVVSIAPNGNLKIDFVPL